MEDQFGVHVGEGIDLICRRKIRFAATIMAVVLLLTVIIGVPSNNLEAGATVEAVPLDLLTNELTRDLFEVNWQLAWVQKEKERLAVELAEIHELLSGQEESLAILQADIGGKWEVLANWLRFAFINTGGSFFYIILQSESMADLFINWYLMERLIDYQASLINDVLTVQAELDRQRQVLVSSKEEKAQNHRQLAAIEVRLVSLISHRQRAFQLATQAEQEYGVNILAEEQYWGQLVSSLEELLAVFQSLDWEGLEPRRVQLDLRQGRAVAEFSQEDIVGILGKDKAFAQFQLTIAQEGMLFTRRADRTISFLADLMVSNNSLILKPKAISIDKNSISPQVVQQLLAGYNLSAPLPEVEPGVVASNIWARDGMLLVEFKLQY
ncbi:MAG: hypothetical protein KGZ96_02475 [Clostridia bacterium]|jgi:peptidoglycan hydrolase CwlO-like protein|nr:hypothetical protein [Clostridia bacterium]